MDHLAPDIRVVKLAEPIRDLGELVRKNELLIRQQIGKWESEVEAFNLLMMAATDAIAVSMLARSSVSFLAPVSAIARAAMEAGARSLWLLGPDDPYEREGRWLAHLDGDVSIRKRLEVALNLDTKDSSKVREFSAAVRAKLPPDTVVPPQTPNFEMLLKSIEAPEKYVAYAFLSQTSHATHYGGQIFRKGLGTQKEFGDFATAQDWWLPLSIIWWSLATPILAFTKRCNIESVELLPLDLQERFIASQNVLK